MAQFADPTALTATSSGTPRTYYEDTRLWTSMAAAAGHTDIIVVGLPREIHTDAATGGHLTAHVRVSGFDYVIVTSKAADVADDGARRMSARLPLAGELELFDPVLAIVVTANTFDKIGKTTGDWLTAARDAGIVRYALTGLPDGGYPDEASGGYVLASVLVSGRDYVLVKVKLTGSISTYVVYARPMLDGEEQMFVESDRV